MMSAMMMLKRLLRTLRPRAALPPRNRNLISSYDSSAPVDYETRAVAFFDILGWRQAVDNSASDHELRRKLLNAVWFFAARTKSYVEEDTVDHPSHDEVSQFSDSLIVSFPYSDERDLFRLLKFVTEFQTSMLLDGLPIRGGVTVGPLFHSGAIAFGPAMNTAYHLESRLAKYPRVIIDHKLDGDVELLDLVKPIHWPFVVKDSDEYFSTDFLTGYAMTIKLAQHLDEKIDAWLKLYQNDDKVLIKYTWLKERWLAAKADAGWRVAIRDKLYADFHTGRSQTASKE